MFPLKTKKINFQDRIGGGSYGSVFPYQDSPNDNRWVVKLMHVVSHQELINRIEEIVLGFSCDHPGILPIKGYSIQVLASGFDIYLKLPRMEKDLRTVIQKHIDNNNTLIPEKTVVFYFYILASALEYLHNKKIVHQDIKPENILINSDGWAVLSDLGGAKYVQGGSSVFPFGTKMYNPPEYSNLDGFPQKIPKKDLPLADMWCLGAVIAEMMILQKVGGQLLKVPLMLDKLEGTYSKVLIELVKCLLQPMSRKRKTATEIRMTLEKVFPTELEALLTKESKIDELPEARESQSFMRMLSNSIKSRIMTTSSISDFQSLRPRENTRKEKQDKWEKYFITRSNGLDVTVANADLIRDLTIKDYTVNFGSLLSENNIKALQSLTINLSKCAKVSENSVSHLCSLFGPSLKTLRNICLDFSHCPLIGDSALKNLATSIGSNLPQITGLGLKFKECQAIGDEGLRSLSSALSEHAYFQNLELDFFGCNKISDVGILSLSAQIFQKSKRLDRLSLTFSHCNKITDESIEVLSDVLGLNAKPLRFLELNFVNCQNITDQGYQYIADNLFSQLTHLSHLDFNFALMDKVADEKSKEDIDIIQKNLEYLHYIGVGVNKLGAVTDKGFLRLMAYIGKNLNTLEYLGLNLSLLSRLTRESIQSIAFHLKKNMKNLKSLDLNMSCSQVVNNEVLLELVSSIGNNRKNLEHLRLILWNCKEVGDEGIVELALNIPCKLQDLNSLDLDFEGLRKISDTSITTLVSSIRRNLKKLKILKLNIKNCPKISEKIKTMIKVFLHYIPNLQITF